MCRALCHNIGSDSTLVPTDMNMVSCCQGTLLEYVLYVRSESAIMCHGSHLGSFSLHRVIAVAHGFRWARIIFPSLAMLKCIVAHI